MVNVRIGAQIFEGVEKVKFDTTDGGTATFEEPADLTPIVEALEAAGVTVETADMAGIAAAMATIEDKIKPWKHLPNTGTEDGSLDANYFQHTPYLEDFNATRGTHLVSVAVIHYEPLGLYKGKSSTLDVPDGAVIGVPNDTSNEARALLLLEANGLITLEPNAGLNATVLDIKDKPLH